MIYAKRDNFGVSLFVSNLGVLVAESLMRAARHLSEARNPDRAQAYFGLNLLPACRKSLEIRVTL